MSERWSGAWLTLSTALLGLDCGSKEADTSRSSAGASSTNAGGVHTNAGSSSSAGGSSNVAGGGNGGANASGAAGNESGAAHAGSGSGGKAAAGGAQGGSPSQAGASTAGGAGENGCGKLANTAAPIAETQRGEDIPAPRGGTVADGTYWLTAVEVYAPARAGAEQHSVTLRVASGHYELVRNGRGEEGMLSTMSIVLKLNTTCPALATLNRPYTATAKTLSLTTVSDNRVEIFTLQ